MICLQTLHRDCVITYLKSSNSLEKSEVLILYKIAWRQLLGRRHKFFGYISYTFRRNRHRFDFLCKLSGGLLQSGVILAE